MTYCFVLEKILAFESELELDNFRQVVIQSMRLFKNELMAEDIYWFLGDRFENMIQIYNKNGQIQIPRSQIGEACPQYICLGKKSQEDLTSLFSLLAKGLYEMDLDDIIHIQTSEKMFLLWPIYGPKTNEKIGDILIESPVAWKYSWIAQNLKCLRQVLSRNLMESLRFVRARELAFVDDLTGLFNQRYLSIALDREISLARRNKNFFSILFLDIDHFKEVNDRFGHLVGSKILSQVGHLIKTNIRGNDVAIRYGGDEYLLLLIGATAENGHLVAERIRTLIEKKDFIVDGHSYRITTSIGIAAFPRHAETKEKLISLADQAMYRSKNFGRNRVYSAI